MNWAFALLIIGVVQLAGTVHVGISFLFEKWIERRAKIKELKHKIEILERGERI